VGGEYIGSCQDAGVLLDYWRGCRLSHRIELRLGGLDLQKHIIDRTDMPIIFITGYGDVPMTVQAMKAGAANF
jgi:FixJ family two-component response regulator